MAAFLLFFWSVFLIPWIVFAVVVGAVASSRGRSFIGWMLLSLLISPLIAIIILVTSPNVREAAVVQSQLISGTKICPRCAERVKRAAVVCKHCSHEFGASFVPKAPDGCPLDPYGDLKKIAADCNMDEQGFVRGWQKSDDVVAHIMSSAKAQM